MDWKNPEDVTFQVTVGQLIGLSPFPVQDICVTVCVNNMSKITCSGDLSEDGLRVSWNHPFLFTATLSSIVNVAISILPKELTNEWYKQPFGDHMITNVNKLLESGNKWQCNLPGLYTGSAILSLTCKNSDILIAPAGHDCISILENDSMRLYEFGRHIKNVPLISTQIELDLARLDLCPLKHPHYSIILNDLGCSYSCCYDQEGKISDLNRAIEVFQTRLDLCPIGHPNYAKALGELATALWKQYTIQRNKEDLNRLIAMEERWLDLCPPSHTDHRRALGELAISLSERYTVQKDVIDLNAAIEMREKALDLCPTDHPEYSTALGNLALSMNAHYYRQRNLMDLNRAIDLQEKCLELCPPCHQNHGYALRQLAISLKDRFHNGRDYSDHIKATMLLKEALNTYPMQHYRFALIVNQLAATILLPFNSSQSYHPPPTQALPSLDEAFETYALLKACGPAVSLDLLQAVQDWVKNAEFHNHSSVLEAYQTLLNTLDHFTSLSSSLDSRHESMQARVANIANNAFSCATRHGNFQMAVELLEQGRGILWNQLARFDISIVALGDREHELERKFTRLSAELRQHAQRSGSDLDPYWRVQEEWRSVVDKIRSLDELSRFLLPPCFDDLQHAAEHGPVIIVNASKYTCDALIILYARSPIRVALLCSLADVEQLCSQLSEITQDVHAYGTNREFYLKQVLRELWTTVVDPIVSVLQDDVQLAPGSRIWWCPTSKFTILPFHAAGPHRKSEKNLMDIYISSYAPSISALIRARDRLRSQSAARDGSGTQKNVSFAVVGQARPSVDTNLGELPEIAHEIQRIRDETHMPPNVAFDTITGGAATIKGAVQAFRDHRWVHVACHGAQHAEKPFNSWFAMGDGKLTLMRIIQERYTNSEFAFLSACHTAVGDASTPDEVLHLAAGMQFAGFNGVIGTLWRVDDAVAHQVVTEFYKEMFGRPVIDFEYAATALNAAVLKTADEISLEKRIVFVHIGI